MGGQGSGGQNRKPLALKLLHGDDKKNPQRVNRHEPIPAAVEVVPPTTLTPAGLAVWSELAPDRLAKGVLTAWDVDAFALFCEAVVLARHAARRAGDPPIPGAQTPMGRFRVAVGICATLGSRFGWSPADRERLDVARHAAGTGARDLSDLLSGPRDHE